MKKSEKYRGIFPAFYACYDEAGEISGARTEAFADYLIGKGVDGLYVGGSSGECIYQLPEERMKTLEHVMRVARGRVPVIAHIACPSTRDSIRLAQHAAALGVDAVAAIPPVYFVLPERAIYRYWMDMVEATELDFIIYNIPACTQYALSLALFEEMRRCPKVIGLKNSSLPVQDIQKFKAAGGPDFVVFNGPDEQYISGRLIGADAGIGGTYAAMPELFLAAERALQARDLERARAIQDSINAVIYKACSAQGSMYALFKEVLKRRGMDIGGVRAPLAPLGAGDKETVAAVEALIDRGIARFGA